MRGIEYGKVDEQYPDKDENLLSDKLSRKE